MVFAHFDSTQLSHLLRGIYVLQHFLQVQPLETTIPVRNLGRHSKLYVGFVGENDGLGVGELVG